MNRVYRFHGPAKDACDLAPFLLRKQKVATPRRSTFLLLTSSPLQT